MLTQAPKGTGDILPSQVYKWQYVENMIRELCAGFGYREIRTPVFEHTELFQRGVGDATDIVRKEMYTFPDKGGRSITLRPEGTAGAARSYIEHGMDSLPQPVKLYYIISAYRYENVQKGRYREFHQFGVEAFGSPGPSIDVEIISILDMLFRRLGLKKVDLKINSIGCPACRKDYNRKLTEYFKPMLGRLCSNCMARYDRNPLRIIDCKEDSCKNISRNAPIAVDNLCRECDSHFQGLKTGLDNLCIDYSVDTGIVRGLDYYTKTVFEFVSNNVGTQGTVCGGGRYDGLVETCGGSPTPGIGFGLGLERLFMEMGSQGISIPEPGGMDIFVATVGNNAESYAESLVYKLRCSGVRAEKDYMNRSLKAQMKYAGKIGTAYTLVMGDDELEGNRAVLKDMKSGEQREISLDTLFAEIRRLLAK